MTEVTDLERPFSGSPQSEEVLRSQRRMKMKEIKESILAGRPELYSPPSLTHVNEWREGLSKAEKASLPDRGGGGPGGPRGFYPDMEMSGDKQRHGEHSIDIKDGSIDVSELGRGSTKMERQNSFKTKIFRNGHFNDVEDPGYSSASPYGSDPSGGNPISLPGGSLNSSISSAKVIFDERIYKKGGNVEEDYFRSLKNFHNSGPEAAEGLEASDSVISKPRPAFSSTKSDSNDSFMSILSRSFSKKLGRRPSQNRIKTSLDGTAPTGGKETSSPRSSAAASSAPTEGLELKDSQGTGLHVDDESWRESENNNNKNNKSKDPSSNFLSRSVTASEFGDPDVRGLAKSKDSPPSSRNSFFRSVSRAYRLFAASKGDKEGVGLGGGGGGGRRRASEDEEKRCLCKESEHHFWSRKISWGMFFFLLLIDIITIIIMMIVFDKIQELRTIENISLASISERRAQAEPCLPAPLEKPLDETTPGGFVDPKDPMGFPSENESVVSLGRSRSKDSEGPSNTRDERNIVINRTFEVLEPPESSTTSSRPSSKTLIPSTTSTITATTPQTTSPTPIKALLPSTMTPEEKKSFAKSDERAENTRENMENLMPKLQKEINVARDEIYQDVNNMISSFSDELQDLRNKIEALKRPPVFSCYRTSEHRTEGVIKYTDCNIKTPGMNPATGKFTVQTPGIYRLTFTGLFKVINGHAVNADIIKRTYGGSFDFLGRSSADTDEIGTFFQNDDDLIVTTSLVVSSRLDKLDEITVRVRMEGSDWESSVYSSHSLSIHFLGQRLSD